MAENLVQKEYAVNYQSNEDILGDGDMEEWSNQASKSLLVFVALANEQYRTI